MNFALEKITGKKVRANEGKLHKSYRCPECLAPVFFIDPSLQVKHFRHERNTAKKDCSLYHVADGHDISPIFKRRAYRQRQPHLFLRLSRSGERVKWELIVLVSKIDEFASFGISNSPNPGKIPMAGIDYRGRECPVYPNHQTYKIGFFKKGGGGDIEELDGLGEFAIFKLSADLCPRVEQTEPLLAGQSYVIVYNTASKITAPSDVNVRHLDQNDTWKAFIFRLPSNITEGIRKWVTVALNNTLRVSVSCSSILWPETAERLNDGTWRIPKNSGPIIVGVSFTESNYKLARLTHEDGSGVDELQLYDQQSSIQIDGLSNGYHELNFDPDNVPTVALSITQTHSQQCCQSVTLEFTEKNNSFLESLWSKTLIENLRAVSHRKRTLRSISIPRGCPVRFRHRIGGNFKSFDLAGIDPTLDSLTLLSLVNNSLLAAPVPFEIDAGGFGSIIYPPQSLHRTREPQHNRKTNRSRWIELTKLDTNNSYSHSYEDSAILRAHLKQLANSTLQP